jgi:hypothetical protein
LISDAVKAAAAAAAASTKSDVKGNVVVVATGIAKKVVKKSKGELIEQNVDGLEV